ncbi:hypothetical protein [Brucella pseudogrignonensis]|uniref:hypothetical protein n=1 Tax=Brucella pseudogrignonensis TaxID=419475 RepID=UPI000AB0B627|nr:hypothetical protein [Brucella pseudogrignonensis]
MIPAQNIVAWGSVVPWADERQVEQDLIISRALIDIFNDDLLSTELHFRGGTALNKLHFPESLRYSEDRSRSDDCWSDRTNPGSVAGSSRALAWPGAIRPEPGRA